MRFTLACWVVTRAIILAAFLAATPHHTADVLGHWDGAWYGAISLHGYEYAADGGRHNVAFFPLFPMLGALAMRAGLGWPLAGAIVNNAAFLGAALVLFAYARKRFDVPAARWISVALCSFPLSLFGTVAYSEGTFLLFSALALSWYDRRWFALAGIAAALASAARPLGIALVLALIVAAVVERRNLRAFAGITLGFLGIAGFAAFCAIRFGDPLAFVHVQHAWRHGDGPQWDAWLRILHGALFGRVHDAIAVLMLLVAAVVALTVKTFGTANRLYVLFAVATLVLSGEPASADRVLYSVVPVVLALGLAYRKLPYAAYAEVAASLVILALDAMAFAKFAWVA